MNRADPVHVAALRGGVDHWNEWRSQNPGVRPNLFEIDLSGRQLQGVDFSGVDLRGASLSEADLRNAKLVKTDFYRAESLEGKPK
jgi:uncharacterized protein YjbI with pentapeptide repeats